MMAEVKRLTEKEVELNDKLNGAEVEQEMLQQKLTGVQSELDQALNDLAARNEKQPSSKSLTPLRKAVITDDREAQTYIDFIAMEEMMNVLEGEKHEGSILEAAMNRSNRSGQSRHSNVTGITRKSKKSRAPSERSRLTTVKSKGHYSNSPSVKGDRLGPEIITEEVTDSLSEASQSVMSGMSRISKASRFSRQSKMSAVKSRFGKASQIDSVFGTGSKAGRNKRMESIPEKSQRSIHSNQAS
jgi:hypothetical protein